VKFAGLGGDSRFIKSDLSGRWYYPLMKDPNWGGAYVLALGGSAGYGLGLAERASGEKDLPILERYFLGGMNSVRGFAERSLGPTEPSCRKIRRNGEIVMNPDGTPKRHCHPDVVGGDQAAVLNLELMFPVLEQYGLRGTAFFDMGQAFATADGGFNFADLRRSVGVGARWMSPFGPLRLELGFPLNKQPGDETSVLGFSFGNPQ
jgi:outer membrane protein insertion porin family